MKIVITVQDKDLDYAIDRAIDISEIIYNKYKLKYFKCECLSLGPHSNDISVSFRKYILFDILGIMNYILYIDKS